MAFLTAWTAVRCFRSLFAPLFAKLLYLNDQPVSGHATSHQWDLSSLWLGQSKLCILHFLSHSQSLCLLTDLFQLFWSLLLNILLSNFPIIQKWQQKDMATLTRHTNQWYVIRTLNKEILQMYTKSCQYSANVKKGQFCHQCVSKNHTCKCLFSH